MKRTAIAAVALLTLATAAHAKGKPASQESDWQYRTRILAEAQFLLAVGEKDAAVAHACRIPSIRDTRAKAGTPCPK